MKRQVKRPIPVAQEVRPEFPSSGSHAVDPLDGDGKQQARVLGPPDPATHERDYENDQIHFRKAMDQYKRDNRRPFPTWSEALEVLVALGYRKVAEPTPLPTAVPPTTKT